MDNFVINASEKTPYLNLKEDGNIKFGGISMPEDAVTFYNGVLTWLSDYYNSPSEKTNITVGFRYLNSSSSRMMLKIFRNFKSLQATGKTMIKCVWYYDEDDIDMKDYIQEIARQADNIDFEVLATEDLRKIQI